MPDAIQNAIVALLVLFGAGFCLAAAIGVLRFPDTLLRLHANTKAATMGCGLVLVAFAVAFPELRTVSKALAALAFLLVTAPVATHVLGRAAFILGLRLTAGTVVQISEEERQEWRREHEARPEI